MAQMSTISLFLLFPLKPEGIKEVFPNLFSIPGIDPDVLDMQKMWKEFVDLFIKMVEIKIQKNCNKNNLYICFIRIIF